MTKGKAAGDWPWIEVQAGLLRAALAGVTDVVEARSTVPILSNLRLTARGGRLEVRGTDLDLWIARHVAVAQGPDDAAFDTTVAAKLLAGIVAKLDAEGIVRLTLEQGRVRVACGRARFDLPTLPVEDYPDAADADMPHAFEVPAFSLGALLDATRFAMSTEETRYYLCGVYLHASERPSPAAEGGVLLTLRGAATDGHRLARYDVPLPDGAGALGGVILPAKAVKVIDRLADGWDGIVEVEIGERGARFAFPDVVLTTKLIDGSFPDYSRVIPNETSATISVAKADLVGAVERVMLMAEGKTPAVRFEAARDTLTVSTTSPERGQASEELACDVEGSPPPIGFNGRYALDILRHVAGDTVEIAVNGAADAAIWRDANPEAVALHVLMPLRV